MPNKKRSPASAKQAPSRKRLGNRADPPIEINDTSGKGGRPARVQYQIDSNFLVLTGGGKHDAIIFVRGYKAVRFKVLNVSPPVSHPLDGETPWTVTLNDTVEVHSEDNKRITIDFGDDTPSATPDGTVVFPEHLTKIELDTVSGTTTWPNAHTPVPDPGFHVQIDYCLEGNC